MRHTLFTIYGPISIHSYGLMIAAGLLLFLYLIKYNIRFHTLRLENKLSSIMLVGVLAGLFGGRILSLITDPTSFTQISDLFTFWQGGFSILGTVIAILVAVPLYLKIIHVPIFPFLDLIAIYAPLLQAISRIGCFFSGCCYGIITTKPWGIIYTDHQSAAPLYVCLHPTQLYSAIGMLIIFALMYFIFQHKFIKTGQLICLYLIAISLERFFVDFWRADKDSATLFSINQHIAIGILITATVGFIIATFFYKHRT